MLHGKRTLPNALNHRNLCVARVLLVGDFIFNATNYYPRHKRLSPPIRLAQPQQFVSGNLGKFFDKSKKLLFWGIFEAVQQLVHQFMSSVKVLITYFALGHC